MTKSNVATNCLNSVSLSWSGKSPLGYFPNETLTDRSIEFVIGNDWELNTDSSALVSNSLVKADNLVLMYKFREMLKGQVKLIYIDPPFNAQQSFYTSDKAKRSLGVKREVAYDDIWSKDGSSYLQYLWLRLQLMRELLSEDGSIYVHCDYRASACIKLLLEEIFGPENYINECIWSYRTGGNAKSLGYARKHDTIHFVVKNRERAIWNLLKEKSYLKHKYGFKNIELGSDENGIFNFVTMRDVWEIPALRGNQPERVNYPTQKPEQLLERIIRASSNPGDLVADFFCGSGTTGVVANKLGRKWLLVDKGQLAINAAKSRLIP